MQVLQAPQNGGEHWDLGRGTWDVGRRTLGWVVGAIPEAGQPSSQNRTIHTTSLIESMPMEAIRCNTEEKKTHMANLAISARVVPHVDCFPTAAQAENLARAGLRRLERAPQRDSTARFPSLVRRMRRLPANVAAPKTWQQSQPRLGTTQLPASTRLCPTCLRLASLLLTPHFPRRSHDLKALLASPPPPTRRRRFLSTHDAAYSPTGPR